MFTDDYLMRIINQAVAALLQVVGLRRSGKYSQARDVSDQAIELLTGLPAVLVDQLDDASVLVIFTANGNLELERLAVLADLLREQGGIFVGLGQVSLGNRAYARALRLYLEIALAEQGGPTVEQTRDIQGLLQIIQGQSLPVDTQLALSDTYLRLLDQDDDTLALAGLSRATVSAALDDLQHQMGPTLLSNGME